MRSGKGAGGRLTPLDSSFDSSRSMKQRPMLLMRAGRPIITSAAQGAASEALRHHAHLDALLALIEDEKVEAVARLPLLLVLDPGSGGMRL